MSHPQGTQIRVSRQELSRLVGCSREMAGRVLKKLQADGKLHARGKTVVLYGTRGCSRMGRCRRFRPTTTIASRAQPRSGDASDVAALLGELGYPCTATKPSNASPRPRTTAAAPAAGRDRRRCLRPDRARHPLFDHPRRRPRPHHRTWSCRTQPPRHRPPAVREAEAIARRRRCCGSKSPAIARRERRASALRLCEGSSDHQATRRCASPAILQRLRLRDGTRALHQG